MSWVNFTKAIPLLWSYFTLYWRDNL